MDRFEYESYDAVGLSELIAGGHVSAAELVETAIEQIETVNPHINAVVIKHYERARRQAAAGDLPGPFFGVPFLTKDLAAVAGDIDSFASVFFRNFRPEQTDEYQLRTHRAGLISLGRTNSPEFGLVPTTEPAMYGASRNPWNREYSTGGSSGGSAAAVASRMVPMAHASDGGGSIRIPASACGVFGMKPTRGRQPRYPESPSDYLSIDLAVSRSVRDSAALLDVTHGAVAGAEYHAPDPEGSFAAAVGRDPGVLRIAVTTEDFRGTQTAPQCVLAIEQIVKALEEAGHEVEDAKPVVDGQSMAEAFLVVWETLAESIFQIIMTEASKQPLGRRLRGVLGEWRAMKLIARIDGRKAGRDSFEPFTWRLAERSRKRTPAELQAARTELQRVSHVMGEFLDRYDSFLTPVTGQPPLRLGELDQEADWDVLMEQLFTYVAFTPIANFTGFPAMSVPVHWTDDNLPVGAHFMNRYGDEMRMFSLAGQLETALAWTDRRPAIQ